MSGSAIRLLVLHGPNLNLLGKRERDIYGDVSLGAIDRAIRQKARETGVAVTIRQTNSEGTLVEWVQQATSRHQAIVINPAAYTHTSVALRDAIAAVDIPTVEVHLSNIAARESFRRHSFVAEVAAGQISGFGVQSYLLGVEAACHLVKGFTLLPGRAPARVVRSAMRGRRSRRRA